MALDRSNPAGAAARPPAASRSARASAGTSPQGTSGPECHSEIPPLAHATTDTPMLRAADDAESWSTYLDQCVPAKRVGAPVFECVAIGHAGADVPRWATINSRRRVVAAP